jgi:hypothetical protein
VVHPAPGEVTETGWREQTRNEFASVIDHLAAPNLPSEDGTLIV